MPQTCLERSAAQVAPFPLAARSDLVRRSAVELSCRHGQAAVDYWRQLCRSLADQLVEAGCGKRQASGQVLAFQAAVQAEMRVLFEEKAQAKV